MFLYLGKYLSFKFPELLLINEEEFFKGNGKDQKPTQGSTSLSSWLVG